MAAPQTFYATHSPLTDPGKHAALLAHLPTDIASVSHITQGLIYHYMMGAYVTGYQSPPERQGEIDTRTMERILGRLSAMDPRPLTAPRGFADRMVGCCRDFALLTCAILRQAGQPARLRYGFADYFEPGYWIDHVIVETWDGATWQRFDPQMHDTPMYAAANIAPHLMTHFLPGGAAWDLCRAGQAEPARFGLGSAMPQLSGWPFIRSRLMLDAAALTKREMLCWDQWGLGNDQGDVLAAKDEALFDQLATLTGADASEVLRALFITDSRIQVPQTVTCYSPAVGPHDVTLTL
ncbi:MAG: transglutaminase domain-containing protein [Ktedonobacterales bacterium]|nr:transglutaminase domain-containing protein [Ktedonobacterales bacterium]